MALTVTNLNGTRFGTTGSTINVTASTPTDGSSVTLTFTNTDTSDEGMRVQLVSP